MEDNGEITLPPETTTPMPPTLHTVYDRHLGWPGRPADDPGYAPIKIQPIAWTPRQWPAFVKKMSDRSPTVTP